MEVIIFEKTTIMENVTRIKIEMDGLIMIDPDPENWKQAESEIIEQLVTALYSGRAKVGSYALGDIKEPLDDGTMRTAGQTVKISIEIL